MVLEDRNLSRIRKELDRLGIPPLKRFGQHFLVDKRTRDNMVAAADLSIKDRVLEIGPGLGFLTAELVKHAGAVVAVEKDRTLAAYLKDRFSRVGNLSVVQDDALRIGKMECTKIVSSPPYNISSKLILFILDNGFDLAVLLLQLEFVQRLIANSGTHEYGRLTATFQARAQAEFIVKVPQSAFYPMPKVDSAIVTIKPRINRPPIIDKSGFEELVRVLFTQRRRKLDAVLSKYLRNKWPSMVKSILADVPILEKRIFQISPPELADLSNLIAHRTQRKGEVTDA